MKAALLALFTISLSFANFCRPGVRNCLEHDAIEGQLRDLDDQFHHGIDGASLSAGSHHTCAIAQIGEEEELFAGPVVCWGDDTIEETVPPESEDTFYVQVTCGSFHTCALTPQERAVCWGDKRICMVPEGVRFSQISAGHSFTCGVRSEDQGIQCWGGGARKGVLNSPEGKFVQVSCGKDHCCAVAIDGSAHCWGSDRRAQSSPPKGRQFVQVVASNRMHSCGILDASLHVMCWGDNSRGQSDSQEEGFTQISAGSHFTCGIKEDSSLKCWGHIPGPVPEGGFLQVSAGDRHFCAVRAEDFSPVCVGWDGLMPPEEFAVVV